MLARADFRCFVSTAPPANYFEGGVSALETTLNEKLGVASSPPTADTKVNMFLELNAYPMVEIRRKQRAVNSP